MTHVKRAFVIGHPIAHSRSPLIHGHWLEGCAAGGSYERIDVPPDALPRFLDRVRGGEFVGGNVTLPLKEAAFRLVDSVSATAGRLGAVNTIRRDAAGRLHGDNTDGFGFVAGIDEAVGQGWERGVRTALVIGAGGAARAVLGALLDRGVASVLVVNRDPARAAELVRFDPARVEALPWPVALEALARADLLVNTTQLGMAGQPPLDLALDTLPTHAIVADIVYVPLETPLLAAARRHGLRVADGLGMLLHQARPGFESWFGENPAVTPALRALVEADLRGGGR